MRMATFIGVAKPGHTRAAARASLIFAPASASYLDFLIITKSCTFMLYYTQLTYYNLYTFAHLYIPSVLVSYLSFRLGNSPGFSPKFSDHETYILNFQNGGCRSENGTGVYSVSAHLGQSYVRVRYWS